jgi:hypothetical protein
LDWSWLVFPPRAVPRTPIKRVFHEEAMTRLGLRRICAYLYARDITPKSKATPLATASARFRNVKRS